VPCGALSGWGFPSPEIILQIAEMLICELDSTMDTGTVKLNSSIRARYAYPPAIPEKLEKKTRKVKRK